MLLKILTPCLALISSSLAIPISGNQAACSSYTLLNTRGTSEKQGQSAGFMTMNSNIQAKFPGGKVYNTVYPASTDQDTTSGTADIINHITSTLASNPSECFILQGYSQGATATVKALPQLTGASFDAVKALFLIGNPMRKPGLSCNVDNLNGTTTENTQGVLQHYGDAPVPATWTSKTLDVCILGDGVCDFPQTELINDQHLEYITDTNTQTLGASFIQNKLV